MQGRTHGAVAQQPHPGIICSGCGERIDLSQPLPVEGWHAVHACDHQEIEVFAVQAGLPPWAWRTVEAGRQGDVHG